ILTPHEYFDQTGTSLCGTGAHLFVVRSCVPCSPRTRLRYHRIRAASPLRNFAKALSRGAPISSGRFPMELRFSAATSSVAAASTWKIQFGREALTLLAFKVTTNALQTHPLEVGAVLHPNAARIAIWASGQGIFSC